MLNFIAILCTYMYDESVSGFAPTYLNPLLSND